MKFLIGTFILILLTGAANAQYYFKDIVSSRQNMAKWQAYKAAGVRLVRVSSFEADGRPTEGFQIEENVNPFFSGLNTHTKTSGAAETWTFATYSPLGLLTSITDTSDNYQSVSTYQYDDRGRLLSITNISTEMDNQVKSVETHLWRYSTASGQPTAMLKIMNGTDTTYVRFIPDEKGNIGEERATRNGEALPSIYYYYDDNNRLTDVARFNEKAQRILPDNMFEYDDNGRMTSLLAVQEGASSYQKWFYEYNDKGLRIKESCYNKQRELLGHIEYQYSYK